MILGLAVARAYMADRDDVITNVLKDHLRNAGFGKVAIEDDYADSAAQHHEKPAADGSTPSTDS